MKLIQNLWGFQHKHAEAILNCLQDRLDWLEEREPESDGITYSIWEEKRDELEAVIDRMDEYVQADEDNEDEYMGILQEIESYQNTYGGMSRLEVFI